jgi:uncharacterized membrane protein
MDEDFEDFGSTIAGKSRRRGWATMAGAGIGVVLGAILVLKGFLAFLVALLFAVVGGAIGRYWVGD